MLYKDLTTEQQKHLHGVLIFNGGIQEDATHISLQDPEDSHVQFKAVNGVNYYWNSVYNEWYKADRLSLIEYYEIPTDFCRVTGKVLHIGDAESENIEEPLQPSFPGFHFKLSCGDRPEVRQWLKDNGCKWIWNFDTDLTTVMLNCKFLYVHDTGNVTYSEEEAWKDTYKDWPVVEPIFKVTGYKLTEESKALKQKLDKITELRNNVNDIQKQIEELEKDLRGN